jgi:LacI family repressor for deo operon, udp, cdd, tsx, nupC, and nupG
MKRVTCRAIGKQLGFSHVTVSLALRNHSSLPVATRKRIQAVAKEMGYRPDPALTALNAYRQSRQAVKFRSTLGWVHCFPTGVRSEELFYRGAVDRAEELGFQMEEFQAPTREDWKRLPKTLKSRGIEGLLLPPFPHVRDLEGPRLFPWHDFYAVALGELAGPKLHLVINDQFQSAALALRELRALGYQKIGFITPTVTAWHNDFLFLGGYLSECARLMIPPRYLLNDFGNELKFKNLTARWLKKEKLDAVIAPGEDDIFPALAEAGLRMPQDIAVAFVSRSATNPAIAAVDQNYRLIGHESANQLSDLMRRNERGVPTVPMRHLVEGRWVGGVSAPRRDEVGVNSERGI